MNLRNNKKGKKKTYTRTDDMCKHDISDNIVTIFNKKIKYQKGYGNDPDFQNKEKKV